MEWLQDIVLLCGQRCSMIDLGQSYEGRKLPVIKAKNYSFAYTVMVSSMDQDCFARWRLSSSVTLPAGGPAIGRVGGRAADTARRASTVTFRLGDTLALRPSPWLWP